MVAGSILPVALHKNKLYFLFGKENPLEDSSKGWSDFGGGVEGRDSPYDTAIREGAEELTGFLGDEKIIESMLRKAGRKYKLVLNDYHVHMFLMDYDENLPKYYNNNHSFLWENMNKYHLNKTKLFEKIEIDWFSVEDMQKRRGEFRNFYRDIVDKILNEIPRILSHMRSLRRNAMTRRKTNTRRKTTSRKKRISRNKRLSQTKRI